MQLYGVCFSTCLKTDLKAEDLNVPIQTREYGERPCGDDCQLDHWASLPCPNKIITKVAEISAHSEDEVWSEIQRYWSDYRPLFCVLIIA